LDAPEGDPLPVAQITQLWLPPLEYFPEGQLSQLAALGTLEYLPLKHMLHEGEPVIALAMVLPAGQSIEHADALDVE